MINKDTEPGFPDNFGSELEAQIEFFRDTYEWVKTHDYEFLRTSKEMDSLMGAKLMVLGHAFMKLNKTGVVPPYEGLKEFEEWYDTNNMWYGTGKSEFERMGKYQLTLIEKTLLFFAETFGIEVIEC